ncbi:aldo/keto reductase [Pelagicoccus sp. NFK12]|uniref:Aldo/keto reductase n=1 Tax=Pelagicoccus enzymogenes TaxID=2773457 RepID=A0A927F6M6_9BACT|nr:aldo/keto reductase [Pelagicoccus enzymogenes]MBD5778145.1 aldo/keto reductase [Pelagicoccus enzymogenes]
MDTPRPINRRHFLKTSSLLTAGLIGAQLPLRAESSDALGYVLPKRPLGKTGLDVTLFCIGGAHIGSHSEKSAAARIEAAIEGGCRFFETAQGYQKGRSEERFGKFLTPKYREHITLMTKTTAEDGATARRHLDESLSRMKTDYLDIYLMRWIKSEEDAENRIKNGVYDFLLEAKAAGKIKHIGFSGHTHPDANIHMMRRGLPELEVVLMPINVVDTGYHSFINHALPVALEKELGVIAMKTMAGGSFFGGAAPWGRNAGEDRQAIVPEKLTPKEAHHYALSFPIASLTSGTATVEQVKENIASARSFAKLDEVQRQEISQRVATIAATGSLEHYKGY